MGDYFYLRLLQELENNILLKIEARKLFLCFYICNPLFSGRFDPVPSEKNDEQKQGREIIKSNKIISSDNIVSPAYTQDSGSDGTYGSKLTTYFHTRTGKSAGTQRSNNADSTPGLGTNGYFFKSNFINLAKTNQKS